MRTLSTLTALALGAAISAQPVLDGTNTLLVPGPVYTVNVSPLVDPGPAGADVVWDFSGLPISVVATVTLVDPADEPVSGDLFPQATLLTANNLTGQLKGYEVTDTYIDIWGIFSNSSQLLLQQSNAVRELVLPCTMGTTWTDADSAIYFLGGSQVGVRSGTTTGTADGYGELILPTGSFANVLRVHLEQTVTDETNFGTTVTTGHRYQYYLPGFPAPLAETIDFTSTSGGNVTMDQRVQWMNDVTAGLYAARTLSGLGVYPNPAEGLATLTFVTSGTVQLRVLDMAGRVVKDTNLGRFGAGTKQVALDLAGFAPGAYTVQVAGEAGSECSRLIVR